MYTKYFTNKGELTLHYGTCWMKKEGTVEYPLWWLEEVEATAFTPEELAEHDRKIWNEAIDEAMKCYNEIQRIHDLS